MSDGFQQLLNAGDVWWAPPQEAQGGSYWHPNGGIVLDGVNFFDLEGDDPYANLRLATAAHEAAHEYGITDEGLADDAAKYCTKQTNIKPLAWGGNGGGGSGDDSNITCWILEREHYWYYPDTGEWEYLYTTTYTWCEPS